MEHMSDVDFWVEVRRGLITIGRALLCRYGWRGLIVILNGKIDPGRD